MPNRAVPSTLFGFQFQMNAAIVLMLENIKEVKEIRLEGKDDIEITLEDNTSIIAQAKAVMNSCDYTNILQKLKDALSSLADASSQCSSVKEIIYITNSPNPLSDIKTRDLFLGTAHQHFSLLPSKLQTKITTILSQNSLSLDVNKLKIQVLPFNNGEDREKYKFVWQEISDFIGTLGVGDAVSRTDLHRIWTTDVFNSGTIENLDIKLSKEQIIWPIIVYAIRDIYWEYENCNHAEEEYLLQLYKELINDCSERFELITKIFTEFYQFCEENPQCDQIERFISNHHQNYSYLLDDGNVTIDSDIKGKLLRIILRTILHKQYKIRNIKAAVNL